MQRQFDHTDIAMALGTDEVTYLGTGSYGESWHAKIKGEDRALKIFHAPGYSLQRLRREITGHRRVDHDNVVKLHNAYLLAVTGIDRLTLEFEYIDGGPLSAAISASRPSASELRELARSLLEGVAAIHAAHLLHRDLKPDNIALRGTSWTQPVILDLGLAKLLDVESITRYPTHVGTIKYMAPEQLRGERALKASDLWAVGVVLFEVAAARHPFFLEGESLSLEQVLTRLRHRPALPADVPADVAGLIDALLSPQAFRRGTTAKALRMLR